MKYDYRLIDPIYPDRTFVALQERVNAEGAEGFRVIVAPENLLVMERALPDEEDIEEPPRGLPLAKGWLGEFFE